VKGIAFAHGNEATALDGYAAPTCALGRGSASSTLVAFDGFPLWAVGGRLSPQTELAWKAGHGDEAVYVASGELQIAGRTCPAGGAVVVEAGFEARLSSAGGASVLHFGPWDPEPSSEGRYGAPALGRRAVHVVGPGGTYAATEPGRDTRMFADSTCPTCRITLFVSGRDGAYESAPHSHSADEILYVLRGDIRLRTVRKSWSARSFRSPIGKSSTLRASCTIPSFKAFRASPWRCRHWPAACARRRASARRWTILFAMPQRACARRASR